MLMQRQNLSVRAAMLKSAVTFARALSVATAFTAATFAAAGPARAGDLKAYPAAFCADYFSTESTPLTFSADGVANASADYSAILTCPVVKDSVYSTGGLNGASLRYYKADGSSVLADLTSYSAYGTSVASVSRDDVSSLDPSGYKTFYWPSMESASEGYYVFTVVLGNSPSSDKTRLISYLVDEN